jgi:hypothetical protein
MRYSIEHYTYMWNQYVKPHTPYPIPPYQEYVDRENFFEDYLDIFKGKDTRAERGLPGPHPFESYLFEYNPSLPSPKINAIVIGEAAPHSTSQTYFYNPAHLEKSKWLSHALAAFGIQINYPSTPEEKVAALYKLALNGFILLDLYPFAIDFSAKVGNKKTRNRVEYESFWNNLVSYIDENFTVFYHKHEVYGIGDFPIYFLDLTKSFYLKQKSSNPTSLMFPKYCTLYFGETESKIWEHIQNE